MKLITLDYYEGITRDKEFFYVVNDENKVVKVGDILELLNNYPQERYIIGSIKKNGLEHIPKQSFNGEVTIEENLVFCSRSGIHIDDHSIKSINPNYQLPS